MPWCCAGCRSTSTIGSSRSASAGPPGRLPIRTAIRRRSTASRRRTTWTGRRSSRCSSRWPRSPAARSRCASRAPSPRISGRSASRRASSTCFASSRRSAARFTAENEVDGRHRVAVLSDGLWRRRFGGDPAIVGRTIPLEGGSYEVVGVMPPDFAYPVGAVRPTDLWVPYVVPPNERIRNPHSFSLYLQIDRAAEAGRLRSSRRRRRWTRSPRRSSRRIRCGTRTTRIGVRPLRDHLVGARTKSWMLMLLGAVGIVLLIACANVANLLLARASAREREVGIRAALGAGRWRLVRQLMVESLVLSIAGTMLAIDPRVVGGPGPQELDAGGRAAGHRDRARPARARRRRRPVARDRHPLRHRPGAATVEARSHEGAEGRRARQRRRRASAAAQRAGRRRSRARGGPARRRGALHRQLHHADADRSGLRPGQRAHRAGARRDSNRASRRGDARRRSRRSSSGSARRPASSTRR